MRLKKLGVFVLAGVLACTAPLPVMAAESAESAMEVLVDSNIDSLISDPDKAVDIIMYVKEQIDEQDISDDQIREIVDYGAENLQISLTDSEKDSVVDIAKKLRDINIDEEQLRSQVTKAYDKLKSLGIEKEDVKNIIEKAVDFVKGLFE